MGVLKVNVGTALAPDWRKVGCGSGGFTFTDNFTRADSSTSLGSPWIVASGEENLAVWDGSSAFNAPVWGISSNQAYNVNSVRDTGGTGHPALAVIDAGAGDIDMSVTLAGSVFSSERLTTGVVFRAQATPDPTEGRFASYYLWTTGGTVYWKAPGAGLAAVGSSAGFVAAGSVMRVLAVGSNIGLYVNGSLVWSLTSSNNTTATCHGLGGNKPFGNANRWDNFSLTAARPGRLKLWDGTRWIREKCTDDHGTVLLSDDFTRANSTTTPGGAWNVMAQTNGYEGVDVYGGTAVAGISSNAGYVVSRRADFTIGQSLYTIVTQDFGTADVDISLTIVDNGTCGIMARVTDGSSGMLVAPSAGVIVGLDGSTLTTFSPTSAGDVLRLVCSGTTCTLYKNGTLVVTFSNSYTGTRHGWGGGANFKVDNFTISTVLIPRPLKVWDGSAWQTVACMVPA